ncbi:hypothetical protein [Saccharicrinis sp. 156]|uniref:hypothetical protein n=1 Tax=Saccharicrinis sp. 156 TaxID=3417574 RepID=UPI003D32B272
MIARNKNIIAISLLITALCSFVWSIPFVSTLSIGIFLFAFYLFIDQLGNTIPIKELAFLVASLQLLMSSFIAFYIQDPDKAFLPKVLPNQYFSYAVPGILLFALGLFSYSSVLDYSTFKDKTQRYKLTSIAKQLIAIGYVAIAISPFVPGGLRYFFTLLVFLSYIGGIIFILEKNHNKNQVLWILIAFLPVVRDAFFSGVFYLAMIWIAFAFLYYMLIHFNWSYIQKATIIILAIFMITTLDGAKKDYRDIVWEQEGNNLSFATRTGLLGQLFWERLTFKNLTDESNLSARVTRANQGALVTWVMKWVPDNEPYAQGQTIKDAVIGAIFPRFLMPNKAKAGGVENFERFTGHNLINTSMNISLLGEGWANFGYWGGLIFMYTVGLFYSFAIKKFATLINNYPIYFFFIPYLFIYIIKAEDDLLTPLNHIIKASIVLFLLHRFYIRKITPVDVTTN